MTISELKRVVLTGGTKYIREREDRQEKKNPAWTYGNPAARHDHYIRVMTVEIDSRTLKKYGGDQINMT